MRIKFLLTDSFYNCDMQITDNNGTRCFKISIENEADIQNQYINIDIAGEDFILTLIPIMADYRSVLNDWQTEGFKEKIAKKVTNALLSTVDNAILRVGCKYHMQNMQDGDIVEIGLQTYIFGSFDRYDLLGLLPMMYMFFEATCFGSRIKLLDAFGTNKNELVKTAKKLSLAGCLGDGFIFSVFTYPFQVGRIKHLCRKKKIFKTLDKFYKMSPEERQRLLDKFERLTR